jgi:hypothetical protein
MRSKHIKKTDISLVTKDQQRANKAIVSKIEKIANKDTLSEFLKEQFNSSPKVWDQTNKHKNKHG